MIFKMTRVYLIDATDKAAAWETCRTLKESELLGRLEYESMKPAETESWTGRIQKQVFGKR